MGLCQLGNPKMIDFCSASLYNQSTTGPLNKRHTHILRLRSAAPITAGLRSLTVAATPRCFFGHRVASSDTVNA